MSESEIDLEELVARFRANALHLITHAEFWEIRVTGGNGKARIELTHHIEPVTYRRPRGGQLVVKRKPRA